MDPSPGAVSLVLFAFCSLHLSPVLLLLLLLIIVIIIIIIQSGTCHFPRGPDILKRLQVLEALFWALDSCFYHFAFYLIHSVRAHWRFSLKENSDEKTKKAEKKIALC